MIHKVKKEVVWTPNKNHDDFGGNTGFNKQTKKKLNLGDKPPPRNLADLP